MLAKASTVKYSQTVDWIDRRQDFGTLILPESAGLPTISLQYRLGIPRLSEA
jgi:hypothetical protein